MKTLFALTIITFSLMARIAFGHGLGLTLNTDAGGAPSSINSFSQSTLPPLGNDPTGPGNLFFEVFGATPNPDGSYRTNEGFAFQQGAWPDGSTYTFNVISPLWFADGSGDATPATTGTYINITDRFAGNPDGRHPGATAGATNVYGNVASAAGFQVALTDAHELAKNLFLPSGANGYGAFGFAFNVTAHFVGGQTLTTGPLVDAWMTDIGPAGGFATNASEQQQESAIMAIYRAAMRGDFNIDGIKSNADLPLMLGALADLGGYQSSRNIVGRELLAIGDVNGDGVFGNDDIQPLLTLLANQSAMQGVPEPGGLSLGITAFGFLIVCRWRCRAPVA